MSLFLLVLLFVCVLLLATAYLRYRMSQPSRANRVVFWNKKDKFTVERILQKVAGNKIASFIINTASSPNNAISPMNYYGGGTSYSTTTNQPTSPFQSTTDVVVVNNNNTINLSGSRPKNRSLLHTSYLTSSPSKYLTMNQHQSIIRPNSTPKVLVPSKLHLEPTSPNSPFNQPITLSEEEFSNTMIYRKPIERLENKKAPVSSISKSPTLNVHSKIANGTPSHTRTFNDTLTNLEISPIAPKDNTHSLIANTSWVVNNGSILIEDSSEKEYLEKEQEVDSNRETNEIKQKEEETTGINDLSMISVGDMTKKSPKGILKVRGALGTKQHDLSVNLSNLNDSVLNSSALSRKKKVDFGFNMEGKGVKRDRPKGFDKVVPAPSETSFPRDVQKRTKTNDQIMTETNQQRQDQSSLSPPKTCSSSVPLQKPETSFVTEADKSILNDSIINSSYEEKEEKPKRKPKSKGRLGFATPKTIQKQRVLTCKEDILQRKELMIQLLRGDQSLVNEEKTEETKKPDNNLGSSFNLSSLARKKDDDDKPSSVTAETSSTTTTIAPKTVTTAEPPATTDSSVTNTGSGGFRINFASTTMPTSSVPVSTEQSIKTNNITTAATSKPGASNTIINTTPTSATGFQFKTQVASTQSDKPSTSSVPSSNTTVNLNVSQFKIPSLLPSGDSTNFGLPKPTLPSSAPINVQSSQQAIPTTPSANTMATPSNPMPSITSTSNFMSQPPSSVQQAQQPTNPQPASSQLTNPFSSTSMPSTMATRTIPPPTSATVVTPSEKPASNLTGNVNTGSANNATTNNPVSSLATPMSSTLPTTSSTISNTNANNPSATISTSGGIGSNFAPSSATSTSMTSNPTMTSSNNPFTSLRPNNNAGGVSLNNSKLNTANLSSTSTLPSSSITSTAVTPSNNTASVSSTSVPSSSTNVFASVPKPSLSLQNAPTVPNPFAALKAPSTGQSAFPSGGGFSTTNPFASVNTSKGSSTGGSVFATARFSFGDESDNTTATNKPNTFSSGGSFSFLGSNNPFGSSGFGTSGFGQRK
nr:unnamed protein product [Naegleria fowleri]